MPNPYGKKLCLVVGPIGDEGTDVRIHADWLLDGISVWLISLNATPEMRVLMDEIEGVKSRLDTMETYLKLMAPCQDADSRRLFQDADSRRRPARHQKQANGFCR